MTNEGERGKIREKMLAHLGEIAAQLHWKLLLDVWRTDKDKRLQ